MRRKKQCDVFLKQTRKLYMNTHMQVCVYIYAYREIHTHNTILYETWHIKILFNLFVYLNYLKKPNFNFRMSLPRKTVIFLKMLPYLYALRRSW